MLRKIKSVVRLGSAYQELVSEPELPLPIVRKDGLEYDDMIIAFDHISQELNLRHNVSRGHAVHMVVCGGACSVMLLKNRTTTKEIDFYIPDTALTTAISDTQDSLPDDLRQKWPRRWVTGGMMGYFMMFGCERLYENSIRNNVKLYESDYLQVFAADWKFQLISKITRAFQNHITNDPSVQGIQRKEKDLGDALAILTLLMKENGGPLNRTTIRAWYNGSAIDDREIEYINEAYNNRFDVAQAII